MFNLIESGVLEYKRRLLEFFQFAAALKLSKPIISGQTLVDYTAIISDARQEPQLRDKAIFLDGMAAALGLPGSTQHGEIIKEVFESLDALAQDCLRAEH